MNSYDLINFPPNKLYHTQNKQNLAKEKKWRRSAMFVAVGLPTRFSAGIMPALRVVVGDTEGTMPVLKNLIATLTFFLSLEGRGKVMAWVLILCSSEGVRKGRREGFISFR